MDWEKHGKRDDRKPRRVPVPVSKELDKLMTMFRDKYPDSRFSDTKILGTMVEAGFRLWIAQNGKA